MGDKIVGHERIVDYGTNSRCYYWCNYSIIGVITVLLANLINWQRAKDKLGKNKTSSLEGQHDNLSSEYDNLSSGHSKIEHNLKGLITYPFWDAQKSIIKQSYAVI